MSAGPRDVPAIDSAPCGGAALSAAPVNGLAFFSSVAERARLELLGLAKHLPGVIAGRIGLRRRGAELDLRDRACGRAASAGVDLEAGPRQRAQPVAREQHDRAAALRRGQRLRVLHVGGGEHLGLAPRGDLVLQQSRTRRTSPAPCRRLRRLESLRRPRSARRAGCRRRGARPVPPPSPAPSSSRRPSQGQPTSRAAITRPASLALG